MGRMSDIDIGVREIFEDWLIGELSDEFAVDALVQTKMYGIVEARDKVKSWSEAEMQAYVKETGGNS